MANERLVILIVILLVGTIYTNINTMKSHKFVTLVENVAKEVREDFSSEGTVIYDTKETRNDESINSNSTLLLDDFRYTPSTVIERSETQLVLVTSDEPSKTTDWYTAKIQDQGMQTKTFVRTNANGNIRNLLVGGDDQEQLNIEIISSPESNESTITVTHVTKSY